MIPSGYKEDVVYSQIPTDGSGDMSFSRASNGTRVNSAGLVEVCPWNLFTNSEDAPSGWGNVYNIASVTANSTTAPNGTNTGNLIVENSVNSTHWFEQSFTAINGTPYTLSVYFKAKERTQCALFGFADNGVFATQLVIFDLSNGTVVSQSGTQTNSITDAGNGWYRCSITLTAGASATGYFAYGLANGGSNSYQGNGTSGLYMWGRQLNTGTLKPYFPTTDRLNVPRLTYQNGGGGCPSLLLEKQSTNIATYSEDATQWNSGSNVGSITVTANNAISPDGTQNADKIEFPAVTGSPQYAVLFFPFTASATAYTGSFYMKGNSGGEVVWISFTKDGVNYTQQLCTLTTSWQRFNLTSTLTSGADNFQIGVDTRDSAQSAKPAQTIYIWGRQLEASSYATSYIGTTSSSATRVADACYKTGISSLIGQTEGVFFAEFTIPETQSPSFFSISAVSSADRIIFGYYDGSLRYYTNSSTGGFSSSGIIDASPVVGQVYKIAVAYKNNDFVVYKNGTNTNTLTTFTVPASLTDMDNQGSIGTGQWIYASVKQILLFKTRLSNSDLQALTTI